MQLNRRMGFWPVSAAGLPRFSPGPDSTAEVICRRDETALDTATACKADWCRRTEGARERGSRQGPGVRVSRPPLHYLVGLVGARRLGPGRIPGPRGESRQASGQRGRTFAGISRLPPAPMRCDAPGWPQAWLMRAAAALPRAQKASRGSESRSDSRGRSVTRLPDSRLGSCPRDAVANGRRHPSESARTKTLRWARAGQRD